MDLAGLRPSQVALLSFVVSALSACGGRVAADGTCAGAPDCLGETGTGADTTGQDAWEDVLVSGDADEIRGTCGVGACVPGDVCSPEHVCRTCYCNPDGSWACSFNACPADVGLPCPAAFPTEGTKCELSITGFTCTYAGTCGTDVASCTAGVWHVAKASCLRCPIDLPSTGSLCDGPINCPYFGPCGFDFAECDATTSHWQIQVTSCSDPCPAKEPKIGDTCLAGGKCRYLSSCGLIDTADCDGTGKVKSVDVPTCPSCPTTMPTPASSCGKQVLCRYPSACGGTDIATCNGAGSWWVVLRGACP